MKRNFGSAICFLVVVLLVGLVCGIAEGRDLGDLKIPAERLPGWNPGVEGGIPDTSGWHVFCKVTDAPYNAVANDDKSDAAAINAAIAAAAAAGGSQVVYLPAGTFRFDDGETIFMKSNVVLRGAGMEKTIITGNRISYSGAIQFNGSKDNNLFKIVDKVLPRGAKTVTLNDAGNVSVGQYLHIYHDNDLSYTLPEDNFLQLMSHIFKVKAKVGNKVTMDRPLRHVFNTKLNPRGYIIKPISNCGLEEMKVMFDDTKDANVKGPIVVWELATNTWAKNVYFYNGYRSHVKLARSTNTTMEHCRFERLQYHANTKSHFNGYSIVFMESAIDNLITNNVFVNLRIVVVFNRGCSGNVYSYNYHNNANPAFWSHGIFFHGKYPHSNLVEGNDTNGTIMAGDNWWGREGPRNTLFRNRLRGKGRIGTEDIMNPKPAPYSPLMTGRLNMIGNIVYAIYSTPGCTYENGGCYDFDRNSTNLWAERNITRDMRGAGYGFIEKTPEPTSVFIENASGDKAPASWAGFKMPASLYLDKRPDFWPGDKPWPGIGADVDDFSGKLVKLPAQQWYQGK